MSIAKFAVKMVRVRTGRFGATSLSEGTNVEEMSTPIA
ncbi:hypothetical protein Barb6_02756 [Bacteroidales bacterium Barb6]|nr:hypothetical protein Barb6_02756 [Bacteroidales bacterium Barb6]